MNLLRKASISAILSALVLCFAACGDDEITKDPSNQPTVEGTTPGSLANYLANDSRFKVLATALARSGKLNQLDDLTQSFTLFAPVDAAFNALPNSFMTTTNFVSTGDPAKLTINISNDGLGTLLLAHVVTDNDAYSSVAGIADALTTAAGNTITVSLVDPTPANDTPSTFNDNFPILNGRAQVLQENVTVSNGRIHVIDTVLIPTTQLAQANEIDADAYPGTLFNLLEATPLFRPFLQLLRDGGEYGVIGALNSASQFTLFVPAANLDAVSSPNASDTAYLHFLEDVTNAADLGTEVENTRYARLAITQDQDDTLIQGTKVIATDLQASNGVIHVIQGVIPFPARSPADIITTLGELTSFADLLNTTDSTTRAKLLDTLRTDQTHTIFAPSNSALAAFDALKVDLNADDLIGNDENGDSELGEEESAGMLAELEMENYLENLLLYHTTAADNVQDLANLELDTKWVFASALTGVDIAASLIGKHRVLNGIIEVQKTISVGNSYVHIIGNVLVPDDTNLMALTPTEIEFPGSTADALAYFTLFSGYASLAEASPVAIKLDATHTGAFTGTLMDLFAFDATNPALLADTEADPPPFEGQFVDPYAIDTDGDGAVDTNFEFAFDNDPNTAAVTTTTAFVPVNSASLSDTAQYLFDLDLEGYAATEIAPYHAVASTLEAANLITGPLDSLTVSDGAAGKHPIAVDTTSGVSLNNGQATVKHADLVTKNGVIHVINNVINP